MPNYSHKYEILTINLIQNSQVEVVATQWKGAIGKHGAKNFNCYQLEYLTPNMIDFYSIEV